MKITITANELIEKGVWEKFCLLKNYNVYGINEGRIDLNTVFELSEEEAKELHLI